MAIATNETFHILDRVVPDSRLLVTDMNEPFPTFGPDIDVVFDLAGSLSKSSLSITSAVEQSDVVIVPIYAELKSINAGLNTLAEVLHFNQNVIVVATKLQRR